MNWTVIIIETLAMTAAFTAMILIPLPGRRGPVRLAVLIYFSTMDFNYKSK